MNYLKVCLSVLQFFLAVSFVLSHDCIHDAIMEKVKHMVLNSTHHQQYVIDFGSSSHRRLAAFAPMRMHLDISKLTE